MAVPHSLRTRNHGRYSGYLAAALSAAIGICSATSLAAGSLEVRGNRIELVELSPKISNELGQIDMGPAPAPGASRTLTRKQLQQRLRDAGFDSKTTTFEKLVTVHSAGLRTQPSELSTLLSPHVTRALPRGVQLVSLRIQNALVLSPENQVGRVTVPKLAKRIGTVRITIMIELLRDGAIYQRVPATTTLSVSDVAARYAAPRGAIVRLTIQRGAARITASAKSLSGLDINEIGTFRVIRSGRLLRARLTRPDTAIVIEN